MQKHLKNYQSEELDQQILLIETEIEKLIDCTQCANCCKTISPQVNKADIKRISAFLEIAETEFIEKYLKLDENEKHEMNALPCPFLKDDKCSIYEVRPKDCRDFPHTDKKEFTTRRYLHTANTKACPAVFPIKGVCRF